MKFKIDVPDVIVVERPATWPLDNLQFYRQSCGEHILPAAQGNMIYRFVDPQTKKETDNGRDRREGKPIAHRVFHRHVSDGFQISGRF